MSDYSGNSKSPQSSSAQWKTTSIGDEHASYRFIEQDPYLHDKITPVDGYSRTLDGYKYTVKIYKNGNISVFRKRVQEEYRADTDTYIRTEDKANKITRNFQGREINSLTLLDQENTLNKENEQIIQFKKVSLEEFRSESGWEIFHQHPIVVIENKAMLILYKMGTLNLGLKNDNQI
jgi:hypothetical protein